mmetsp:Transcript_17185/g.29940  ORF Transcript_17185/g.29940 Transcript_17185/m.29940 type:complete len:345 (-) Transcript_17185:301-1335(-)
MSIHGCNPCTLSVGSSPGIGGPMTSRWLVIVILLIMPFILLLLIVIVMVTVAVVVVMFFLLLLLRLLLLVMVVMIMMLWLKWLRVRMNLLKVRTSSAVCIPLVPLVLGLWLHLRLQWLMLLRWMLMRFDGKRIIGSVASSAFDSSIQSCEFFSKRFHLFRFAFQSCFQQSHRRIMIRPLQSQHLFGFVCLFLGPPQLLLQLRQLFRMLFVLLFEFQTQQFVFVLQVFQPSLDSSHLVVLIFTPQHGQIVRRRRIVVHFVFEAFFSCLFFQLHEFLTLFFHSLFPLALLLFMFSFFFRYGFVQFRLGNVHVLIFIERRSLLLLLLLLIRWWIRSDVQNCGGRFPG